MKLLIRKSFIDVVGKIWMPATTRSMRYDLTSYDIDNIEKPITRETVDHWLSLHSGDFQSIQDFSASIEDGEETVDIPFATEEGECAYLDTFPSED